MADLVESTRSTFQRDILRKMYFMGEAGNAATLAASLNQWVSLDFYDGASKEAGDLRARDERAPTRIKHLKYYLIDNLRRDDRALWPL